MSSPETSAVRRQGEIGKATRVQLGVVAAVAVTVVAGPLAWCWNLHEKVSLQEQKLQTIQAMQDQKIQTLQTSQEKDRDAVEKRLDRIEMKLDRALDRNRSSMKENEFKNSIRTTAGEFTPGL